MGYYVICYPFLLVFIVFIVIGNKSVIPIPSHGAYERNKRNKRSRVQT